MFAAIITTGLSAVDTIVLSLVTASLPVVLGFVLQRKRSDKQYGEIHVLVNSRLAALFAEVVRLKEIVGEPVSADERHGASKHVKEAVHAEGR